MIPQKNKQLIQTIVTHTLFKGSLFVFAGAMFANFAAYLYHLLIGRILGPIHYGELAALFSLFSIINVPSATLQNILVKYFSELKARGSISQIHWLFFFVTKVILSTIFILFFVLLPLLPFVTTYLQISHTEYVLWLYFIFATALMSTVIGSAFQALQLFKESTLLVNIGSMVRLGFGVIAAPFGVGWVLVSNIFSNLIMYIVSFIPIRFLMNVKAERFHITPKYLAKYSFASFFTTLGITSLYSQDVVLVKHFFDAQSAGLYSSLSVLGRIIFFATAAIGFVVFPVITEYKEQGRNYRRIAFLALGIVALTSISITSLYFIWPDFFVHLLFGKAFSEITQYMGLFGIFISFFSLSSLLTLLCLGVGKTLVWLFVVIAAISQIVLIYWSHTSLYSVTLNNIYVCASLFVALLLYFAYAKR